MNDDYNIPIQMISVCSTVGNFTPMRFRFESPDHQVETVSIDQVLAHKDTSFNGIKEIQYTCQATIENELKLFIIVYSINTHKWRLFRMLT